jgi:hypothetical protein
MLAVKYNLKNNEECGGDVIKRVVFKLLEVVAWCGVECCVCGHFLVAGCLYGGNEPSDSVAVFYYSRLVGVLCGTCHLPQLSPGRKETVLSGGRTQRWRSLSQVIQKHTPVG